MSAIDNALKNWKTTTQGILSGIVSLSLLVTDSPHNPFSILPPKYVAGLVMSGVVAKVIIATFFQTDGKQTTLNLPPNSAPVQMNIPAGSTVSQTTSIETKE